MYHCIDPYEEDGSMFDANEWSHRMIMSTFGTAIVGSAMIDLGFTGTETLSEAWNMVTDIGTSLWKSFTNLFQSSKSVNTQKIISAAQNNQLTGGYNSDSFSVTMLKEGDFVIGLTPGQSNWYTTAEVIEESGFSIKNLYNGLQIQPHPIYGYRTSITVYQVTKTIDVAIGQALANTQAGDGGYTQYYIDGAEEVLKAIIEIQIK